VAEPQAEAHGPADPRNLDNDNCIIKRFVSKFRELWPAAAEQYLRPDGSLFDEKSKTKISFQPRCDTWLLETENYPNWTGIPRDVTKTLFLIDLLIDVFGLPPDRAIAVQQLLSMAEDCLWRST